MTEYKVLNYSKITLNIDQKHNKEVLMNNVNTQKLFDLVLIIIAGVLLWSNFGWEVGVSASLLTQALRPRN